MSEDNLQRVVRNFSLLPTLDLIHETKYNITLDDVPPIHSVQLQTYISYGLIGLLILLIIPLILCWCYPMAKLTTLCHRLLTCCKSNQQNEESNERVIRMQDLIHIEPRDGEARPARPNIE